MKSGRDAEVVATAALDPKRKFFVERSVHCVGSGRARACVNDRTHVLSTQCRSEPAGNEAVHELHALYVPRVRHDIEERTIERQRALEFCELGDARFSKQLRLFSFGTIFDTTTD